MATKDPKKVAERYSQAGVLLPTVSDVPRTDYPGIVDYFTNFLKLDPQGEIESGNIIVGTNWAQDAGIYEVSSTRAQRVDVAFDALLVLVYLSRLKRYAMFIYSSPWARMVRRSRGDTLSSTSSRMANGRFPNITLPSCLKAPNHNPHHTT